CEEVDRELQAPRGRAHRREGDAARRADVRVPRPAHQRRVAARPRLQGRAIEGVRRAWQLRARAPRAGDLPRDRLRQGRQGARHGEGELVGSMRSDPIADMLTRIRNASRAEHEKVDIPASKLKLRVAELLKDEGFIKNFRLLEDPKQGTLRVYLKYGTGNEKMISGIVRVSTPGRRVYVTRDRVPSVLGGMGVALLSTSRGVFTDRDARKQGVGGEVLAYVW